VSTHELYTLAADVATWDVDAAGAARFTWEYDDGRDRLLSLYQKGKDKQWDAGRRIDWDVEVDPYDALGLPEETIPIHGDAQWDRLDDATRSELGRHFVAWQFSQFLHGEQGAMICSSRIVESVPDLDAKFYAATQTMDEARHVELYARFLQEKLRLVYPINPSLKALLDDTLSDGRWDMPYLGMQVLIEGVALAAFGLLRDMTSKPLAKQILAYVMQDEARHVAFGRLALRDHYRQLSSAELAERQDFVVEGCHLLRDRLNGGEVYDVFGLDVRACLEATERSPYLRAYRSLLFSRIVPCVKDIGLWGDKVERAYEQMGVLEMAGLDLDELMRRDDDVAEQLDRDRRELAARAAEVDATVAAATTP
jgi:P-aminobenzoate N-oxygenase AurF